MTISGITGDGTLGISIVAGTASNSEGNLAAASGASATFTVDNTAPVTIANPVGGLYSSAQKVSLIVGEDAVIYYTMDGTDPTESSSQYSSPIPVNATTTLKYFARDTAGNVESVKASNYTIITDIPGDMDGDGAVTIADAIIALQAMAGMHPQGLRLDCKTSGTDVNKDGRLALQEAVYILQRVAGMR